MENYTLKREEVRSNYRFFIGCFIAFVLLSALAKGCNEFNEWNRSPCSKDASLRKSMMCNQCEDCE